MGKSTFARKLRAQGIPSFCADPKCLVKDPEPDVVYLDDIYADKRMWSAASQFVCDHWLTMPGSWCVDGVSTVRALRKLLAGNTQRAEAILRDVQIVKFSKQYEHAVTKDGQRSMATAVESIWREIAPSLPGRIQFA